MTIKPISECPNPLDGIYNPPDALKYAAGYRIVPPLPEVPDGFTETSCVLGDGDGVMGAWIQTVRPTADITAEQYAAKMATFPAQEAMIFRLTMRRNFGDGAETNHVIDAKAVENYFVGKQVNGTITVQELADASVLERLFAELKAWNGTDETWSLFEQYGSLLP
jgi:hypothetical protein